ncbi:hypothetical protein BU26DRAFT_601355 [Trematosphaeria pertusa]|uniref:Uncharacterized protein n=1 Tax=Trematosphaeria pertusa TaxID=390896 RepID=A0A6A6IVF9_9PLEO|nr:uncharacterized protein BU26DRAFT_601355 [Trematosphaeria pertusa]KAF2253183.1 hypothetical protein BU26DRAFT_601355 [Trematosphaeria pertusa]
MQHLNGNNLGSSMRDPPTPVKESHASPSVPCTYAVDDRNSSPQATSNIPSPVNNQQAAQDTCSASAARPSYRHPSIPRIPPPSVASTTERLAADLLPQLDGPRDYHPEMIPAALRPPFTRQGHSSARAAVEAQIAVPESAIQDLLPFCTVGAPLNEGQLVGLSDIAGSLKEVMLLALQAQRDEGVKADMARAVGGQAAMEIIEFFGDEFET